MLNHTWEEQSICSICGTLTWFSTQLAAFIGLLALTWRQPELPLVWPIALILQVATQQIWYLSEWHLCSVFGSTTGLAAHARIGRRSRFVLCVWSWLWSLLFVAVLGWCTWTPSTLALGDHPEWLRDRPLLVLLATLVATQNVIWSFVWSLRDRSERAAARSTEPQTTVTAIEQDSLVLAAVSPSPPASGQSAEGGWIPL